MLAVRNSDTRGIRPAAPFQLILAATLLVSMNIGGLAAQQSAQKTYSSPQQAVQALVTAVKADDPAQLMQILGPEAKAILYSGDPVAYKTTREKFLEKYDQMNRLAAEPDHTVMLYIGAENWPFPVPLAEHNGAWRFDADAGRQEIRYRRVGEDEVTAIALCHTLLAAAKSGAARSGCPGSMPRTWPASSAGPSPGR